MNLLITDIKWDTDGESLEDCGLPDSVVAVDAESADEEYLMNEVSERLSDAFGFCHNGFEVVPLNHKTHAGGGFFPANLALMTME